MSEVTRRDLLCRTGAAAGALATGQLASSSPKRAQAAATPTVVTSPGVREYWVVATSRTWRTSPTRHDDWKNKKVKDYRFPALTYVATEPNFGKPLPPGGIGDNTGMPGPVLRGSPGDTLVVHFKNDDRAMRMPHTMHPHGVHYDPQFDGTYIGRYTPPGGAVKFGDAFTYRWEVKDDSVGVWPYHDHGPMEMESTMMGLFGAIVIEPVGAKLPDVEATIYFHMFQPTVLKKPASVSAINGRGYAGNTPTVRAKVGQDVAFNVLTLGDELHTFHIHGHRWKAPAGNSEDAPLLGPAFGLRARFTEDAAGRWLYHCHVMQHMNKGMVGYYVVDP